ncbi:hypothetical protein JYT86_00835 [bacterium AH-315-N03]|nr:hypothetical protein [bacterium AH-315-N03]
MRVGAQPIPALRVTRREGWWAFGLRDEDDDDSWLECEAPTRREAIDLWHLIVEDEGRAS